MGRVKVVANPLKTYLWHDVLMTVADNASWLAAVIALSLGVTFLILYVFKRWSR